MPQQPHIIRLRLPWELTISPTPSATLCGGCWILRRLFNCPTGLRADDRVVLVVDGLDSVTGLTLNGVSLAYWHNEQGVLHCEVREHLRSHNDLEIELQVGSDATAGDLRQRIERDVLSAGRVRLEIHSRR